MSIDLSQMKLLTNLKTWIN